MHIEPENPFRVEISGALDANDVPLPGRYDVVATYTGSIHLPASAAKHCWLAFLT